ncbi:S49 family peptidase [Halorutilales archaeon Cl-col2-1]
MWRPEIPDVLTRIGRSYVALVAAALLLGLMISPVVSGWLTTEGEVAVVPLEGSIDGSTATTVTGMLERARNDPGVEAVVLRVNSPGGSASASETIYLEVLRTADEMPVVTSVDSSAASGAYYSSLPSDEIYAKPSSFIGSVGVVMQMPQNPGSVEGVITTGPNKLNAGDERDWYYRIETAKRAFVGSVMKHRDDDLNITREEVEYAKLYSGPTAVENGIADEIGGLDAAAEKAAELAGMESYSVTRMRRDGIVRFISRSNYVASDASEKKLVDPSYITGVDTRTEFPNPVMLPPELVSGNSTRTWETAEVENATR